MNKLLVRMLLVVGVVSFVAFDVWNIGWLLWNQYNLTETLQKEEYTQLLIAIMLLPYAFGLFLTWLKRPQPKLEVSSQPIQTQTENIALKEEPNESEEMDLNSIKKIIQSPKSVLPQKKPETPKYQILNQQINDLLKQQGQKDMLIPISADTPEYNEAEVDKIIQQEEILGKVDKHGNNGGIKEKHVSNEELSDAMKRRFIKQLDEGLVDVYPSEGTVSKFGIEGFDVKLRSKRKQSEQTEKALSGIPEMENPELDRGEP